MTDTQEAPERIWAGAEMNPNKGWDWSWSGEWSHKGYPSIRPQAEYIRADLARATPEAETPAVRVSGKPCPSPEYLNERLRYDPETGKLFWKYQQMPEWNARYAGQEAFTMVDKQGYRHGKIDGVKYSAHRIIYTMMHGVEPNVIDHINRDPSDNRISNLRSCTVAENSRNSVKRYSGTSQYRGVSWMKREKAWAARISIAGAGRKSIGSFANEEDAARAYDKAAAEHHGEFAVLNFPDEHPKLSALEPAPVQGNEQQMRDALKRARDYIAKGAYDRMGPVLRQIDAALSTPPAPQEDA